MAEDISGNEAAQVRAALIWAGAVGRMFASRILSFFALAGGIGLGFYVAWQQSWVGVAALALYVLVFYVCVRSEDRGRDAMKGL